MLPLMRSKNDTKVYSITNFQGYNPSYSRKINELSKSYNTSSQLYPALSPARCSEVIRSLEGQAICAGYFNKLYTVELSAEEEKLYLCTDSTRTEISDYSATEESQTARTMEFMKDEILIIPDNIIYHTNTDTAEAGCVTEKTTKALAQEKFAKESHTDDDMPMPYNTWYSAYLTGNSIVSMYASYRPSSTSYRFYHLGLSDAFAIGDVVTIKMTVKPIDAAQDDRYRNYRKKMADGIYLKIKDLVKSSHSTPSGTITEYTEIIFDDNAMDLGGYDEVFVLDISIEKGIPNFVDICSMENRMWGVTADKIHASKLGDPSEWNDFSVDSYGTLPASSFSTEVETDGQFTAITAYNGNIIAFKEDCIHKVYGSEPEEYIVSRIDFPGVCAGAKDTLVTVGGILYYMGKNGIYAYSGSAPRLISADILPEGAFATKAGGDDRYYYIEICNSESRVLYVYDTLCKLWHIREAEPELVSFVTTPAGIYQVNRSSLKSMNKLASGEWSFEISLGTKEFSSKHICAVSVRYSLEENSAMNIYLKNKHDTYALAQRSSPADNGVLKLRLPVSCDTDARLIFEGSGNFVLSSLDIGFRETGIYD